jgi:hypothetical protein
MTGFSLQGLARVTAAAATAIFLTAPPAQPAEYCCRVPRALLCEGCASQIAIALQANGSCRVSFTPEAPPPGPAASPGKSGPDQLELKVETPPPIVARIAPHRQPLWRPHRFALARPAPSPRCFVFNAQRYCE